MITLFVFVYLIGGGHAVHQINYNSWGECFDARPRAVTAELAKGRVESVMTKCVEALDAEEAI